MVDVSAIHSKRIRTGECTEVVSGRKRMQGSVTMFVIAFSTLFAALPVIANNSSPTKIQSFYLADGLAGEVVRSITEAPDGAIWMACWGEGVSRYDGWTWQSFDTSDGLPNKDVRCVYFDRQGRLWCGTTEGIAYWDGARWRVCSTGIAGQEFPSIYSLVGTRSGSLLFGTGAGQIMQFRPRPSDAGEELSKVADKGYASPTGEWSVLLNTDISQGKRVGQVLSLLNDDIWAAIQGVGLAVYSDGVWRMGWQEGKFQSITAMTQASDGSVWAVGDFGLRVYDGSSWKVVAWDKPAPTAIAQSPAGDIYIGTYNGFVVEDDGGWRFLELGNVAPFSRIQTIGFHGDSSVWVGTNYGLHRIWNRAWTVFDQTPSGTSLGRARFYTDTETSPLVFDNEGQLWRFEDSTWQVTSGTKPIQSCQWIGSLTPDTLHVLSSNQLLEFSKSDMTLIRTFDQLAGVTILGALRTSSGQLLTYSSNAIYEWIGDRWRPLQLLGAETDPPFQVQSTIVASYDALWIGDSDALQKWIFEGDGIIRLQHRYMFNSPVRGLHRRSDGSLRFGISNLGIYTCEDQAPQILFPLEGAISRRPALAYEDSDGVVWIGTRDLGVASYRDGRWISYGLREGISNGRTDFLGEHPAGVLWAAIQDVGIVRYAPNTLPPKTIIEKAPKRIPYDDRGVFQYTAVDRWSDTTKGDLTYSWRIFLQNGISTDAKWSEFSKDTAVITPDLPPGHYAFEVRSADLDRNLNPAPARTVFQVSPPIWGRRAFQIPTIGLLISTLIAISMLIRKHLALVISDQALLRAKDAAESANRSKSLFLANMSHELRTPLNAVLGFSQLLCREPQLTKTQEEKLKIIARSGEHLLSLINDVLEMSKMEAGRTILEAQDFNLRSLFQTMESMFSLRAQEKNLKIHLELTPEVPRYAHTDERKLRQVMLNLLSNALKFTNEGGVSVRARYETEKERLHVEVEDTGPGISPEEIQEIFAPFGQTQRGRSSQEGTGLGLTISRSFVELMGGELNVASEIGKGSIFKFDIYAPSVDGAEAVARASKRQVIGLAPGQSKPRILIVEDKKENRQLLLELFSLVGFNVQEAANGQEALDLWETWTPDLIWMDMNMPVMNGYEATRAIRAKKQDRKTTIIALTASAFEADRQKVMECGCDDFARKPYRESDLFEKISKHLNIEYIYEESAEAPLAQEAPLELKPDDLIDLPPETVAELRNIAVRGAIADMHRLIERVRPQHPHVADILHALLASYKIESIIQATTVMDEQNTP